MIYTFCAENALQLANISNTTKDMSAMKAKMRIYAKISRSKGLPARNQLQKSLK